MDVSEVLRAEFSDVADLGQLVRIVVRLGVALVLGAIIGYERERHDKAAGLRTHMIVALGSAVFVFVPQQAGFSTADLSRVIQGLVAGMGFLCAGTILKQAERGKVRGLTTAAGVWATGAIGVAVGLGRELTAIITTVLVVVILELILRLEKHWGHHLGAHTDTTASKDVST